MAAGFRGGNSGMQGLMQQAKKMQEEMEKTAELLDDWEVVGTAANEAVVVYMNAKKKLLSCDLKAGEGALILIPKGATSKAVGHKKKNRIRLLSEFPGVSIRFAETASLTGYDLEIKREERTYKCI